MYWLLKRLKRDGRAESCAPTQRSMMLSVQMGDNRLYRFVAPRDVECRCCWPVRSRSNEGPSGVRSEGPSEGSTETSSGAYVEVVCVDARRREKILVEIFAGKKGAKE